MGQHRSISTSKFKLHPSMAAHSHEGNAIIPPIRFCKTVLKTNLQRLKIPNKFTMRYGGGLPNPVFMKPPDGTEWEVYWAKHSGEIWFEKGWKEFVEHYSLDQGHFVFFKYGGTSHIDVLILDDQTALEIDYDRIDNLDKQMRGESEKPTQSTTSSLNWPTQSRAQEVARNFISNNPFFTVFIKPVHVAGIQLPIPDLKGIIENKSKYVKLQIGERSWNVLLLLTTIIYNVDSFSYRTLSSGWNLFTRESELQPGDVCVFELINREDPVFKVHVFKNHT